MSDEDDLLREFLVESYENLDRLDEEFVALEEDPSKERLSSIFRTIHSIKGTCGFFELTRLESVAHAGENLLDCLREGTVVLDAEITTALLHLVDAVREMLENIESTGGEGDNEYADLVATLKALQEPGSGGAAPETPVASQVAANTVDANTGAADTGDAEPVASEAAEADAEASEESAAAPTESETTDDAPQPDAPAAKDQGKSTKQSSSLSGSNIRVQVVELDHLMNLAGELVLARNQILQSATNSQDATSIATAQRLNLITTELQERIMKVRMQPVGMLWSKFPRVVRDLSAQLGKNVQLKMQGKDTELDKTLLEAINDPLTHIIRNSVDHGIESPDVRRAAGKDEVGTLLLDAYHESGQVFIEIIDDGAGINAERVKSKAVASGLITQEEAANMSERQACSLIFQAGLSTAAKVTNVSGRGVGMDVVNTNIEQAGGSVEVSSQFGKGTTVRIKIPLTLAIIPALIVTAAADRYAIPQVNLVELVRLDGESAGTKIEDLHGTPVYRLRGDLLPLLFLDEQLGVDSLHDDTLGRNIVVVRSGEQLFGLVVDAINDTEEIVVKPLDQQTKSVPVYAGTTILGDGRVALILDVQGLARRAGVLSDAGGARHVSVDEAIEGRHEATRTFLLVQNGAERKLAIELTDVDRLEEFETKDIEYSGDTEVYYYRGEIMPLVRVSQALGLPEPADDAENVRVVVHTHRGNSVGLVVHAITDIVETSETISRPSNKGGIESAVVIDGVVTDLLDLEALVDGVLSSSKGAGGEAATQLESSIGESTRQFCTFFLDDLFFGVDVTQVQEVLRFQDMTRVPLTTDVVSGLINLRGQTLTALDMRRRLNLVARDLTEIEDPDELPMNLVLRTREGIVSILVDRIGDVLTVEDSRRAPVPNTVCSDVRDLITEVYKLDDALLLPLDIERLVNVSAHEAVAAS